MVLHSCHEDASGLGLACATRADVRVVRRMEVAMLSICIKHQASGQRDKNAAHRRRVIGSLSTGLVSRMLFRVSSIALVKSCSSLSELSYEQSTEEETGTNKRAAMRDVSV